jgi:hypothetical protein
MTLKLLDVAKIARVTITKNEGKWNIFVDGDFAVDMDTEIGLNAYIKAMKDNGFAGKIKYER